jgi:hypothetical protein
MIGELTFLFEAFVSAPSIDAIGQQQSDSRHGGSTDDGLGLLGVDWIVEFQTPPIPGHHDMPSQVRSSIREAATWHHDESPGGVTGNCLERSLAFHSLLLIFSTSPNR